MNAFTIKDIENLSGIKAHTIRIWEQRYNFLRPQRTSTNIRYYSNEQLRTVLNVALLNKHGFKISHIGKMQPNEIRDKLMTLVDADAMQERVVNELIQEMADLNMERFEKILTDYIASGGLEKTVLHILFPFLEKIGLLWQTGHINPAQEHLVSNIIRQKLIVAIETAIAPKKSGKSFLLFLPEGEYHELGLLFMYYIIKIRGAQTIYLGSNVPVGDVEHVVKSKKPDIVFVHLIAGADNFNLEKFIRTIEQKLKSVTTIISGQPAQLYRKKHSPNILLKRSLSEVMNYLSDV